MVVRMTRRAWRGFWRLVRRVLLAGAVAALVLVLLFRVVNPPTNVLILSERLRLGAVEQDWVPLDAMSDWLPLAAVAAEDANFCLHWGLDVAAIRAAIAAGGDRGASTISQQVVKNVYLWHGRNWARKALEAGLTPLMEAVWTKERILEVYLNVAEFDEGVFGVEAAAQHYFGVIGGGPDRPAGLAAGRRAARSQGAVGLATVGIRQRQGAPDRRWGRDDCGRWARGLLWRLRGH
jgi:monofunctional glycosyltransferase